MHGGIFRAERIFINEAISLDFCAQNFALIFPYKHFFKQYAPLFCIL